MPGRREQRFIQALDGVEFLDRDLGQVTARLESWLARLGDDIRAAQWVGEGLDDTHALAGRAGAVQAHLRLSLDIWARQWAVLKPAQALADSFDDTVVLLVFGKFNAGKSSFCNFLAERFARHGKSVRYFQVDAGRLVESTTIFKEGSTETTARLQGVVLGEKLLLLDTPGLHSATPENAALTQRYTDSADGVLWLTSSTSPGQVQELDELARELRRNKPLLPVVTRSDFMEEDEVDGELCKQLCNKSIENRELQEHDVHARAADKLRLMDVDPVSLRPPVSISCHAARTAEQTPDALREAGFDRLYDALLGIVGPALCYKQRQPAEMLLHHFEENVLGGLFGDILPQLAALIHAVESERAMLEQRKARLARGLWREVAPALSELLQIHVETGGVQAICDALSHGLSQAFEQQLPQALAGYVLSVDSAALRVTASDEAVAESVMRGPIAGTDLDRIHVLLESALHTRLDILMEDVFAQCAGHLDALALSVQDQRDMLQTHARRLQDIKRELRA
ncbi:50S ribosome-binding GTPase [Alcaligenaceae bacterium]|nr:50S ribosome-binding GTPase [Alcaligenaceae bacterium]